MDPIVITGGRGGLGRAIAAAFHAAGDDVHAPGREELDVTCPDSVSAWFGRHPAPGLLVLNAGLCEDALLARVSSDRWDRQFEVNLHGAFRCARAVARAMCRRRSGHLLFISSRSALHPPAGQAAYAAAKAALIGFSHSLASELGPFNVRSNVVLPGFLDTPMTRDVAASRRAEVTAAHTLGRLNTPEAAAAFIVHLHHHLPHTSGQVFQLDSRIHPAP